MKYSKFFDALFAPVLAVMGLVDFIAWSAGQKATFAVVAAIVTATVLAIAMLIDAWRNAWIARCVKRYSAFRRY